MSRPSTTQRLPAQLHLRVPPPPAPAQVAISAPLTAPPGRPTYTTIDGGWAERLPHSCVPEGEALADAVQRALRGPSEGAFTTTRAAARAEPTRTKALWRAPSASSASTRTTLTASVSFSASPRSSGVAIGCKPSAPSISGPTETISAPAPSSSRRARSC